MLPCLVATFQPSRPPAAPSLAQNEAGPPDRHRPPPPRPSAPPSSDSALSRLRARRPRALPRRARLAPRRQREAASVPRAASCRSTLCVRDRLAAQQPIDISENASRPWHALEPAPLAICEPAAAKTSVAAPRASYASARVRCTSGSCFISPARPSLVFSKAPLRGQCQATGHERATHALLARPLDGFHSSPCAWHDIPREPPVRPSSALRRLLWNLVSHSRMERTTVQSSAAPAGSSRTTLDRQNSELKLELRARWLSLALFHSSPSPVRHRPGRSRVPPAALSPHRSSA